MKNYMIILVGCFLLNGMSFGEQESNDQKVKNNAHVLQLALEDWCVQAADRIVMNPNVEAPLVGCFPADLDVAVSDTNQASLLSMLRRAKIVNPYDPKIPVVILSLTDPFSLEKVVAGQLVYVPRMINTGNMTAEGYRIYGIGKGKKVIMKLQSFY